MAVAIVSGGWAASGVVSHILDCTWCYARGYIASIISYCGIPLQGRGLQGRHAVGVTVVTVLHQINDAAAGFLHRNMINAVEDVLGHIGGVDVMEIVVVVSAGGVGEVSIIVHLHLRDIAVHVDGLIALRCFGVSSARVNGGAGGGDVGAAVGWLVGPGWGGDSHACVTGQGAFIEGIQQAVGTPEVGFVGSLTGIQNCCVAVDIVPGVVRMAEGVGLFAGAAAGGPVAVLHFALGTGYQGD